MGSRSFCTWETSIGMLEGSRRAPPLNLGSTMNFDVGIFTCKRWHH